MSTSVGLLISPNDAEAILILQIAEALEIPIVVSEQPHGARLDYELRLVSRLRKAGIDHVVIVEIPGLKTERALLRAGIQVEIIDHHAYADLDRARALDGSFLPSSLEQFLKRFRLTDARLRKLGFDPFLVRGIGVLDRGYVWALYREGYSKKEVRDVLAYHDALLAPQLNARDEARAWGAATRAWDKREKWRSYYVVRSRADVSLRSYLSRLVAVERGKPTPLIILEEKRQLVYVQESSDVEALFSRFGGFTFGLGRCWGYRNEPNKPRVTLRDIKEVLYG